MTELLPDKDNMLMETWALTEEESGPELSDSSKATNKHLDNSFYEFFLSQEGLLPDWVDG
jgi:hypothetical protein